MPLLLRLLPPPHLVERGSGDGEGDDLEMDASLIKALVIAAFVGTFLGCGSNDDLTTPRLDGTWARTRVGDLFSFTLPPYAEEAPVRPYDSIIGEYRSASMVIAFDYGWYSPSLHGLPDALVEETTIDGRACRIVWWTRDTLSDGLPLNVGVHFPDVGDGENRLTFWARCADVRARVDGERAIRSIDFADGQ